MSIRVFFCFDHEDVSDQRVDLVRQHWLSKDDREDTGIFDGRNLQGFTLSGNAAVKRLIDGNLEHTLATCVLIGTNTWARRWVRYAIVESIQRGNRVVAVHINGIPDRSRRTKPAGRNPLEHLAFSFAADGTSLKVMQYSSGDWVSFPDNKGWPLSKPASGQRRGKSLQLSSLYRTYDWIADNGAENLEVWVGARAAVA
jgi:hypothetical protein